MAVTGGRNETVRSLACRHVRQESALWDALHAGVLTTSCLNGALGFHEPQAAKARVRTLSLPPHSLTLGHPVPSLLHQWLYQAAVFRCMPE